MEKHVSIAIDGPAGAGKSSLAKKLAEELGFVYVDTGAIYRTVGYAAQLGGIESKDEKRVCAMLPGLSISIAYDGGVQKMLLDGKDVSQDIRTPKSSVYASDVSAMPCVRAFLMEMQRKLARENNVIMDGRDIGTVVLPDAGLKIFLTASPEERAKRRYKELIEKKNDVSYEEVLRDMLYRDAQDSTRAAAPLKAAEDAVTVDTSSVDFEGSLDILRQLVRERFGL